MTRDKGVECVAPTGDHCGEGVLWHPDEGAVYWTDINRFLIHRLSPAERSVKSWFFDQPVTSVLLTDKEGVLAVVLGSGLIFWQPSTDTRSEHRFRLPGWPNVRCNDAGVDVNGSVWIGTMRNNVNADGTESEAGGKDGLLYRIDPDGAVSEWEKDLGIANTIVWSPDNRLFYFADSLANTLDVYDCGGQTPMDIANRRPLLHGFQRGSPDGSTIDSEGYVWTCRYGGSCIVRVAPDGKVERLLEMPTENITNCVFGGPDRRTLYVTTARSSERLSGSLFACETEFTGLPESRLSITI